MSKTIVSSDKKEVIIGFEQPFCIIGERINPTGRKLMAEEMKKGEVHKRVLELGGQMGVYNGWERANWFAKKEDDVDEKTTQTWLRAGPWARRIKEECELVRDEVGVLDLPGFSRFSVSGKGCSASLPLQTNL